MSALILWSALLLPQFGVAEKPLATAEITPHFAAETGSEEGVVDLLVDFKVTEGWHIYHPDQDENGYPTRIEVIGEGVEVIGSATSAVEPTLHEVKAGNWSATYLWLEGEPRVIQPVKFSGEPRKLDLQVKVHFMLCDESTCMNADMQEFTLPVEWNGTSVVVAAMKEAATEAATEPEEEPAQDQEEADVSNGQTFEEDREDKTFDKVEVAFRLEGEVAEGQTVDLVFDITTVPGWHVYDPRQDPMLGIPVSVVLKGEGMTLIEGARTTTEPESHVARIGGAKQQYWWQSGTTEWRAKLRFDGPPPADGQIRLIYQACDDSSCLLAERRTYALANYGGVSAPTEEGLPDGFWAFLLAAVSAGFFTLLTPCVFPMIPVTISYFTKRAETGKGTPIGNASAYAGGIIFTFAGIGVGAALLIGESGANQIGSNPWVNMAIGVLFIVMAASLLGFFEIQPPRFLQNFANKAQSSGQQKGGYLPVALMAVAFSITAFTCTVGFVGAVFAAGLSLGTEYLFGGMLVYGAVFALPFFFLALLPSKLQSLPSAGGWMNTVKVCAGFVELLAATKFFSNVDQMWEWEAITWPVMVSIFAIILVAWGAYMFGWYKLPYDYERPKPGAKRKVFAAVILLSGLWMIPAVQDRDWPLGQVATFMPPKHYGLHHVDEETGQEIGPAELLWYENFEHAFAAAKAEGLPLFVDFTGVTCLNCRQMENEIFPHELVKPHLETFTRVALWVDREPKYSDLQVERFKTVTQPYYALIDPRTDTTLATFNGYDPDPEKFSEFLKFGLEKYKAAK